MSISRRGFLGAILATATAPAVVSPGILMPVRKLWVPGWVGVDYGIDEGSCEQFVVIGKLPPYQCGGNGEVTHEDLQRSLRAYQREAMEMVERAFREGYAVSFTTR